MSDFAYIMLCAAIDRGFESIDDWANECPRDYMIALNRLVHIFVSMPA